MLAAVRTRVEVSGHGPTWKVTAGSFEDALEYARGRFGDLTVLDRGDRDRWWPRVTLTVTTDSGLAESAPPWDELARPAVPASLEAIFAHQEELRVARQRQRDHDARERVERPAGEPGP